MTRAAAANDHGAPAQDIAAANKSAVRSKPMAKKYLDTRCLTRFVSGDIRRSICLPICREEPWSRRPIGIRAGIEIVPFNQRLRLSLNLL
jgi:hypothetical protein